MGQGPLLAAGALVVVAGVAVVAVLMGSGDSGELGPSFGPDGTIAGPNTPSGPGPKMPGTTTGLLDPATLIRPTAPVPAGPERGPRGPNSRLRAKRGTKRESGNQRAGRLLDNLEQAVAASDGTAIQDFVQKLLAMGEKSLPDVIDALQRARLDQRSLRKQLIHGPS